MMIESLVIESNALGFCVLSLCGKGTVESELLWKINVVCYVMISMATYVFVLPAIICRDPGTPRNGAREGDSFTYLSEVVFSCDPGYELTGSRRRTCRVDRTWSGSPAACQREYTVWSSHHCWAGFAIVCSQ